VSERLDLLRPYLSRFKRRFTVLDFGAGINASAIGTEIAREFDAVVVCVEENIVAPELSPRTMWLKKEFSPRDLQLMSECEHFDVVIGFNVCHWFNSTVPLEILSRMGRYVFIQSPASDDAKAIETFGHVVGDICRYTIDWKHLGDTVQFPQHTPRPLWMHENILPRILTRTCVEAHENSAHTLMWAEKDRCRAQMLKDGDSWRNWIPGINLANFLAWNGVYPHRTRIAQMLTNYVLPLTQHGDITPHNFILDGESVHLIDGHEGWGGDDVENLQLTIQKVLDI